MPDRSRSAKRPVKKRPATKRPAKRPAKRPTKRPPSPRVRRRRAALVGILLGLGAVAILFLFVYPTSSFLRQRDDLNRARERLEVLRSETTRLDDATKKLQGDAEVERIAREQYGLVRPGEQSYVVIPATTTTTTPPPAPTAPGGLPNRQP